MRYFLRCPPAYDHAPAIWSKSEHSGREYRAENPARRDPEDGNWNHSQIEPLWDASGAMLNVLVQPVAEHSLCPNAHNCYRQSYKGCNRVPPKSSLYAFGANYCARN